MLVGHCAVVKCTDVSLVQEYMSGGSGYVGRLTGRQARSTEAGAEAGAGVGRSLCCAEVY